MAAPEDHTPIRVIHPIYAILLAGTFPLFLGAVFSDWAYASSYQVQWTNFASWLIAGALVFTGFALVWAVVEALRADAPHRAGRWLSVGLLVGTLVLGFVNALVHAKDAWGVMPAGLILSIVVFLLALAAIWAGFSMRPAGANA